jgi:hypothetical protein
MSQQKVIAVVHTSGRAKATGVEALEAAGVSE